MEQWFENHVGECHELRNNSGRGKIIASEDTKLDCIGTVCLPSELPLLHFAALGAEMQLGPPSCSLRERHVAKLLAAVTNLCEILLLTACLGHAGSARFCQAMACSQKPFHAAVAKSP
jgi:hypothetical protein